jgi:hypothetical protein
MADQSRRKTPGAKVSYLVKSRERQVRVFGRFLLAASLLGFVICVVITHPEFLGVPPGGSLGKLTPGDVLAMYILSLAMLLLGLKFRNHGTDRRDRRDSLVIRDRSSHPLNK